MVHGRTLAALIIFFSLSSFAMDYVPGEYVAKLKSAKDRKKISSATNISQSLNLVLIKRPAIELASFAQKELMGTDMFEYVEPNYIYEINKSPNDVEFSNQWGLENAFDSGFDIDAKEAWEISTGDSRVTVAVIDTGVDHQHEDLKENMWTNIAELNGTAGVDDDGNGFVDDIYGYDFYNKDGDPMDDHDHGTHCAGVIGAKGNNGIGIAGINWDVKILALKAFGGDGRATLSSLVGSIDYATTNKVDIMSNSWSGGRVSQAIKDAIEKAEKAGILFVVAAGNHGRNLEKKPVYPAAYKFSNILTVAASDKYGNIASFSNFGEEAVDIAAPGVKITSSTTKKRKYRNMSGTSMATPHVAGVAALLLAHEPHLNFLQLKERIMKTSKPLEDFEGLTVTEGLLSAERALKNIQ